MWKLKINWRKASGALLAGVMLCGSENSFAQQNQIVKKSANPVPQKLKDSDLVEFGWDGNGSLEELIQEIHDALGIRIHSIHNFKNKRITIHIANKIKRSELLDLFKTQLKDHGFLLLTPRKTDKSYKIIETKQMQRYAGRLGLVSKTIKLKHISINTARRRAEKLITPMGGDIMSLTEGGRNSLIISDFPENVAQIEKAIGAIDKKQDFYSEIIKIQDADPAEFERLAKETYNTYLKSVKNPLHRVNFQLNAASRSLVLSSSGKIDTELLNLIKTLDTKSKLVSKTYRLAHVLPTRLERKVSKLTNYKPGDKNFKSDPDDATGTWIVVAPENIHIEITKLIKEFNVPKTAATQSNWRFYKLKNRDANSVLATILSLKGEGDIISSINNQDPSNRITGFTGRGGITESSYTNPNSGNTSKAPAPKDKSKKSNLTTAKTQDAVVTADADTNTIIIVATPKIQQAYKKLIEQLDQKRPQVMVEVTLVTIDTSNDFSLGVELSSSISKNGSQYINFSSFGLSKRNDKGQVELVPGLGYNGAVIRPQDISIIVRALEGNSRVKVLSRPRILVNDNSASTLSSVIEQPFTTTSQGTSTTTTNFGGFASAGTTITVTPHISEGDYLQLKYNINLSSFTKSSGSDGLPAPRSTSELQSEITVPNAHAVVIGGLERMDFTESEASVPFLNQIPVLKYLLGNFEKTKKSSKLFVFIRPIILRDEGFEDLRHLSHKDLEAAGIPSHFPQPKMRLIR